MKPFDLVINNTIGHSDVTRSKKVTIFMASKADFEIHFDFYFVKLNQTDFEKWFTDMGQAVFKTDFEVIKAGGSSGDKKCDGRVVSKERVYQCYAPESPSKFASDAPKKMRDSFPEVLNYWPNLKEWIFVHNNADGLPTNASDTLEQLRKEYPNIRISQGSRRLLKDEFHDNLTVLQMLDIYPEAKTPIESVEMADIRPLIKKIISERGDRFAVSDFGEIPNPNKLDHNEFSPASRSDIARAISHIDVVSRYLDGQGDPRNVSIIQHRLRARYDYFVDLQHTPDEILGRLVESIKIDATADQHAAALVVVAYFFDSCDIFENAPAE